MQKVKAIRQAIQVHNKRNVNKSKVYGLIVQIEGYDLQRQREILIIRI